MQEIKTSLVDGTIKINLNLLVTVKKDTLSTEEKRTEESPTRTILETENSRDNGILIKLPKFKLLKALGYDVPLSPSDKHLMDRSDFFKASSSLVRYYENPAQPSFSPKTTSLEASMWKHFDSAATPMKCDFSPNTNTLEESVWKRFGSATNPIMCDFSPLLDYCSPRRALTTAGITPALFSLVLGKPSLGGCSTVHLWPSMPTTLLSPATSKSIIGLLKDPSHQFISYLSTQDSLWMVSTISKMHATFGSNGRGCFVDMQPLSLMTVEEILNPIALDVSSQVSSPLESGSAALAPQDKSPFILSPENISASFSSTTNCFLRAFSQILRERQKMVVTPLEAIHGKQALVHQEHKEAKTRVKKATSRLQKIWTHGAQYRRCLKAKKRAEKALRNSSY